MMYGLGSFITRQTPAWVFGAAPPAPPPGPPAPPPPPPEGAPVAAMSANRLSGTAPLAVLFNASGTTLGTNGTYAIHDLLYTFTFDDATSGTWGYSGGSKNLQVGGPVAAHVFKAPGTYVVSVSAMDSEGLASIETVTITVADPSVTYAGADTVAVSTSGTFTAAPAGATQVTSLGAIGDWSNKRILLRRGESFGDMTVPWHARGFQVATFDSGAQPIVNNVRGGEGRMNDADSWPQDFSIQDLNVQDGIVFGIVKRALVMGNTLTNPSATANNAIRFGDGFGYWVFDDEFRAQPVEAHINPSELFVVENEVVGSIEADFTPMHNADGGFAKAAYLGNRFQLAHQHSMRFFSLTDGIIAHNRVSGPAAFAGHHAIKLHSGGLNPWAEVPVVGQAFCSERVVIANNLVGADDDNSNWTIAVRPQSSEAEYVEGIQDVIVENNSCIWGPSTGLDVLVVGRRMSVRGNSRSGAGPAIAIDTPAAASYPGLPPEWVGPYFVGANP